MADDFTGLHGHVRRMKARLEPSASDSVAVAAPLPDKHVGADAEHSDSPSDPSLPDATVREACTLNTPCTATPPHESPRTDGVATEPVPHTVTATLLKCTPRHVDVAAVADAAEGRTDDPALDVPSRKRKQPDDRVTEHGDHASRPASQPARVSPGPIVCPAVTPQLPRKRSRLARQAAALSLGQASPAISLPVADLGPGFPAIHWVWLSVFADVKTAQKTASSCGPFVAPALSPGITRQTSCELAANVLITMKDAPALQL